MIWSHRPNDPEDVALAFRGEHSRWLTRALASGRAYPRIPLRRVDEGGFSRLARRANGAMLAARWWVLALARVID